MSVRDLYHEMARLAAAGQPAAVAVIVEARGTTPRLPGARLLVGPDGRTLGSIGGGQPEATAVAVARQVISDGLPRRLTGLRFHCGQADAGDVDVLVAPLGDALLAREMLAAWERREPLAVATLVSAPEARAEDVGRTLVATPGRLAGSLGNPELDRAVAARLRSLLESREGARPGRATCLAVGRAEVLIERPEPIPTLVIAGAGHVGRALARQARLLGFAVVVVDDRPELLAPDTGLEADRVVVAEPGAGIASLRPDPWTYVVLVGPTHAHDAAGLRAAVGGEAAYVGMIGSRTKVRTIFEQLLAEGVDPARLARVHAPIGLRLGAETPEEIALAILAEVLLVHKGAARADVARPPLAPEIVRALRD